MTINDVLVTLYNRKRRVMNHALAEALGINMSQLRLIISGWNDYDESTRIGNQATASVTPGPPPTDHVSPRYRAVIATNEYGEFIPGMLFPALMDFCQAVEKWPIIKSATHVRGICRKVKATV